MTANSEYGPGGGKHKEYRAALGKLRGNDNERAEAHRYLGIVRQEMLDRFRAGIEKEGSALGVSAREAAGKVELSTQTPFSPRELAQIVDAGGLQQWKPTDRPEWIAQDKKTAAAKGRKAEIQRGSTAVPPVRQRQQYHAELKTPVKDRVAAVAKAEKISGVPFVARALTHAISEPHTGKIVDFPGSNRLEKIKELSPADHKAALNAYRFNALDQLIKGNVSKAHVERSLATMSAEGRGTLSYSEFMARARQAYARRLENPRQIVGGG